MTNDRQELWTRQLPAKTATLLLVSLLCGCGGSDGPELGTVIGTVKLDGQPLPNAAIVFTPLSGSISMGRTDDAGQYKLRYTLDAFGAVPGEHKVSISTGDFAAEQPIKETIPVKYNHMTELVKTVESGENTIDFDLESEGVIVQPNETEKLEMMIYRAEQK